MFKYLILYWKHILNTILYCMKTKCFNIEIDVRKKFKYLILCKSEKWTDGITYSAVVK